MIHTKKQRLLFFSVIEKYINEELFLPKLINRLKDNVSQKERQIIKNKADEFQINGDKNEIKILTLFYCLHIQKPRDGYMSMLTKILIRNSEIDFSKENLKRLTQKLKNIIDSMGLPTLEGTTKQFVKNLYYYKPSFIEKYPNLDTNLAT